MSKFQKGDQVLINGSLLATIQSYNEDNDRITYVSVPFGGGTDTTTAHISQTRVEPLHGGRHEQPEDTVETEQPKAAKDEFTKAGDK